MDQSEMCLFIAMKVPVVAKRIIGRNFGLLMKFLCDLTKEWIDMNKVQR